MNNHDKLQIEQAAKGCISGILSDWPDLIVAFNKCDFILPLNTPAYILKSIANFILGTETIIDYRITECLKKS